MFARRAFCSNAIPRSMYGSLHISSRAQAQRLVPSLVPVLDSMRTTSGLCPFIVGSSAVATSLTETTAVDCAALRDLLETLSLSLGHLALVELWNTKGTGIIFHSQTTTQ